MSKLVMVDVLSSFRLRYVVRANTVEDALDEVVMREGDSDFLEFSQKHLEPTAIIDHREITEEEYFNVMEDLSIEYYQTGSPRPEDLETEILVEGNVLWQQKQKAV